MDGQYFFYFNPKDKPWGVMREEARGIMEKWKNNRELQQLLAMFSMGDSPHYLKEFLKHWKEMPSKNLGGLSRGNLYGVGKSVDLPK